MTIKEWILQISLVTVVIVSGHHLAAIGVSWDAIIYMLLALIYIKIR
jgi:hypothetical protein